MVIFEIPALPYREGKKHWREIHRQKTDWALVFAHHAKKVKQPKAKPDDPRVRITIVFEHRGRAFDRDNRYAMCKVPLDALQRAGVLWDDADQYLDLAAPEDVPFAKREHTTIILEEIEE